jgi:hypothetical protein
LYGNLSKKFITTHKKRMFLFGYFQLKFEKFQEIYLYFKGIINSHVFCEGEKSLLPSFYEMKEFSNLNENTADFFLSKKKWKNFICISILNEIFEKEIKKNQSLTNTNSKINGHFLINLLKKIKTKLKSYIQFKQVLLSFLNEFYSLKKFNLSESIVNMMYNNIQRILNNSFIERTIDKYFDFETILKSCYYLYCLIRGVKNSASLEFLSKVFLERLNDKVKSFAFKDLLQIVVYDMF